MPENDTEELIESLVTKIEGAANFMRGMMLDPSIPAHVKSALTEKVAELDSFTAENQE